MQHFIYFIINSLSSAIIIFVSSFTVTLRSVVVHSVLGLDAIHSVTVGLVQITQVVLI